MSKKIKRHIGVILTICLFVFVISYFDIGCPTLFLWGIPCPTCGVTRSILSLLKFDFYSYFCFHPLSLPLIIAVWLVIHARVIKRRKAVYVYVSCVLMLNTFLYAFRLLCFLRCSEAILRIFPAIPRCAALIFAI